MSEEHSHLFLVGDSEENAHLDHPLLILHLDYPLPNPHPSYFPLAPMTAATHLAVVLTNLGRCWEPEYSSSVGWVLYSAFESEARPFWV
jgi:hypothetical protein